MLDLVLPLECGGCGTASTRWCPRCARELTVRDDEPHLITPRTDPGIPVFALGRYAGARRRAIVAAKEHGRADLLPPLANALNCGLERLLTWGIVVAPLTVVPAPTRRSAARRRGGDPVTRIAVSATAGLPGVTTIPALRLRPWVRDSVGLPGGDRQRNLAGRIRLTQAGARRLTNGAGGDVVLVDDVVTTGATVTESVRTLRKSGVDVSAMLAIAHA
ncbi:ComF family protein [Mycolicibacterium goodii]|uniref:Phosphoribosyltransferase n=1 Tax=Mycolicibacterium goodii TaxID=134601 RepID=A0A0K0XD84_MYCGD|nr:phosphoribosyltransferase [Mycolicibacterium goodii]